MGRTIGRRRSLEKKRVLITGGSRGLGLALAYQYARRGANLVLCARDSQELGRAKDLLSTYGVEVDTYSCNLTESGQVHELVQEVSSRIGAIDILINNAGITEIGPIETFDMDAFLKVIDVNLLGMIRLTLDFLPHLKRGARIVNITSLGGAVAMPHMLSYTVSKFGALGFSMGLDAELASRGISVTSVLPGPMRTGSFVHATFRGNVRKEFDWFTLSSTLPQTSVSAESAASAIFWAAQKRQRFLVIGVYAKLLRLLYQVFPEAMLAVMRGVDRFLPKSQGLYGRSSVPGMLLRKDLPRGGLTVRADRSGDALNENLHWY
ncbi:MAG: SDR family NAD(P)-dependent oxidoreductase [Oligoflexia bacterium]|nr:SDR family NAD(P)-dependent oxidoreductase [Oligoflexia bacterium]